MGLITYNKTEMIARFTAEERGAKNSFLPTILQMNEQSFGGVPLQKFR